MKRVRPFKEEEYRNKRTKFLKQTDKSAFGEEIVTIQIIESDSDEEPFIPKSTESSDESLIDFEEHSSDYE
jgi:hypothetical protein